MAAFRKLIATVVALGGVAALMLLGSVVFNGTVSAVTASHTAVSADPSTRDADRLVARGRQVFRFDTFGDEAVWGGVLGLYKAIEGSKLGGDLPAFSPRPSPS